MITLPTGTRIWIIAGVADMRCGFNDLTSKVQNTLKDDPFSGHIFVFRGRSGKMVKILWADRDRLCLFAKRLERGRFMRAMLVTGAAFAAIDKRLPLLISELLTENTTLDDINKVISSVIPDARHRPSASAQRILMVSSRRPRKINR